MNESFLMHFHRHCQFVRRPSLYFENFEKFSSKTRPSQTVQEKMDGVVGVLEHICDGPQQLKNCCHVVWSAIQNIGVNNEIYNNRKSQHKKHTIRRQQHARYTRNLSVVSVGMYVISIGVVHDTFAVFRRNVFVLMWRYAFVRQEEMFDYEDVCYDHNGEGDNAKHTEVNPRPSKLREIVGVCTRHFPQ